MSNFFKKFSFVFLVIFICSLFYVQPIFSETKQKFSITDESVFQKIITFFNNLIKDIVNFWKKNIGDPASRVWDKIRFFFINGIKNRAPEIKKEAVKEIEEVKSSVPEQTETFFQKINNFFKR